MGAHDGEELDLAGIGVHGQGHEKELVNSISNKNESTKGKLLDKINQKGRKIEKLRTLATLLKIFMQTVLEPGQCRVRRCLKPCAWTSKAPDSHRVDGTQPTGKVR